MEIKRSGLQPSGKGPAEWFTGDVRVDCTTRLNRPASAWRLSPLNQARALSGIRIRSGKH